MLPSAWTSADIGAVGAAGSTLETTVASGLRFAVAGSGADIWGPADAFRFVSQPMTGDGIIVARLVSQTGTDSWAKAGLMMRDGTAPGSRHASIFVTPGNGTAFQRRIAVGGSSASTSGGAAGAPRWLRLERSGQVIAASASADGGQWTPVGTATWPMGTVLHVGQAVTSHQRGILSTAVFESVEIVPSVAGKG